MRDILVIDCKDRENFWINLRSGHRILFATTAYEGLNLLSENVGLVFLNLRLLDSNGIEVLRLIKKAYPSIEVIIITSCSAEVPCTEAFRKEASDYIRNPLNTEEILNEIKTLAKNNDDINTIDTSQEQQHMPLPTEPVKAERYSNVPPHLVNGVLKVRDFIAQNYSESLTLDAACKMASISKTYFCHFFKRITGHSLRSYHHVIKIRMADEFLKDNSLSITDIAQQLGYSDSNYFSTIYKRFTGLSPKCRKVAARSLDKMKKINEELNNTLEYLE